MSYRLLAEHYDTLWGEYAAKAAASRQRILGRLIPQVRSACDLCCGTGTTAVALARLGIRMFAVDLSPEMCRAARKKARHAGVTVRVIRADMRDFRLPAQVDLVTCEFDALNHVPAKANLGRVARAVSAALRPQGWFYFDVNNSTALKTWPSTFFLERPGVAAVMHGGYNHERDSAWVDVELFVREGRCWRRRRERVEEVCWTTSEITCALRDAGFDKVRTWDGKQFFPDNPLVGRGRRTLYLAQKG